MKCIKTSVLVLLTAFMPLTFTSCGENTDWREIASIILNNLLGQQGVTYNFTGKGTMQVLQNTGGANGFVNATERLAFQGTLPLTVNNSAATLQIPSMTLGNYQMSNITFSNLVLRAVTNGNVTEYTSVEVGDNTTADGSITVNGTSYPVTNLYMETKATNTTLTITIMSIYFGQDNEFAVNVVFTGTAAE